MDANVGDEVQLQSNGTEWFNVVMMAGGGLLLARSDGTAHRLVHNTCLIAARKPEVASTRRAGTARINNSLARAYLESEDIESHNVTVVIIPNPGGGHFIRRFSIPESDFSDR